VRGVDHVIHMANPIPGKGTMTKETYIDPVKKTTRAMLEACKENQVQTFVLTSSTEAISGDSWKKDAVAFYDENDRNKEGFGTIYA